MSDEIHSQWQLKRENGIKYWIEIKDFRQQVHQAHHMEEIQSEKFKIGESMFRIEISSQDDDFLGVFLANLNEWRVRCSYTFRAGEEKFESRSKSLLAQNSCRGDREFFSLDKIDRKRILKNDGRLVLEVDVQLLEEEVLASTSSEVGGEKKVEKKLSSLTGGQKKVEKELSSIKVQLANVKEEIAGVKDQMAEVKALLKEAIAARL